MNGITAITTADILNAPVRNIRSADPYRTPESAVLKRGFVYGLLEPETRRLRYIGSTTRTLAHRMSCYRSVYRTQHTTSPLLRYAESTNGFDNWEIIPLKIVHFCPRYRSNALKDEEQGSIAYWRTRGADLLNKNKAILHSERADYQTRWRLLNGQGRTDANGRSMSNSARYCREWREQRRQARLAAQQEQQPAANDPMEESGPSQE